MALVVIGVLALFAGGHALRISSDEEKSPEFVQQIKDMDTGFPQRKVACPHVAGQPYLGTNDSIYAGPEHRWNKDVPYCAGMIKAAEQSGNCLIYNFGVGRDDNFLHHMAENYPKCEIFAFDPTINETRWEGGAAKWFGPNVKFQSWGLYGGEGSRELNWFHYLYQNPNHRVGGVTKGTLYTLEEIQKMLGHTDRRINYFRSDCEGCEWAWVEKSVKDHPDVFERIDQMFTEIHFADTLRFDDEAMKKTPSFHKMVMDNYDVNLMHKNKGFNRDRFHVYKEIANFIEDPEPCCREYLFINKKYSEQ